MYVILLLKQRTVNAAYYSELLAKLERPISLISTHSILPFHNNAQLHLQAKLEEFHWATLDHLPIVQVYHHVIFICLYPPYKT